MHLLCRIGIVGLLAAGCLPSRDNDRDPANAPAAALQILDRTDLAGGCLALSTSSSWPSIVEASRGACLALDARGTSDPQGTEDAQLTFRFSQRLSDGTLQPAGTLTSSGAMALLDDGHLSAFVDGETARFHVAVEDPNGALGETEFDLSVRNSPPAVFTDPPRTIPLHGYSWAAAPDLDVSLDFRAGAVDPDGDTDLQFMWTFEDGTAAGTGAYVQVPISTATPGRRVLYVTAGDGDRVSDRIPVLVSVGEPNLWDLNLGPDGLAYRVGRQDSHANVFPEISNAAKTATVFLDATLASTVASFQGSTYVIAATQAGDIAIATWPDMVLLDSVTQPDDVGFAAGVAMDEAGRVIVSFFDGGASSSSYTTAWSFDGSSLSASPLTTPIAVVTTANSPASAVGPDALLALTSTGVWHATRHRRALSVLNIAAGTATQPAGAVDSVGDGVWTGLAARPESNEVWAIRGLPALPEISIDAAAVRFGAGDPQVHSLAAGNAAGIAWIDHDRFWTSIPERGLCVVEVALLEVADDPATAMSCVPSVIGFVSLVVDPITGTAFWNSTTLFDGARTELDGTSSSYVSLAFATAVDPNGDVWSIRMIGSESGDILSGQAPTIAGGALAELAPAASDATLDGEGGVWLSGLFPNALRRIAQNGAIMDVISELATPQGIVPLPLPISLDETNGHLWMEGASSTGDTYIYRIDTRAARDPLTPARAPAELFGLNASGLPVFGQGDGVFAAGPLAAPSAWLLVPGFFSSPTIRYTKDESYDTVAVTAGLDERAGAVSPAGDRFCFASRASATVTLSMWEPPPTGMVMTSSWTLASTGVSLSGVGASAEIGSPDEELCWVAFTDHQPSPPVVYVYAIDEAGARVREYIDLSSGPALDLLVVDSDHIWLLRENLDEPEQRQPERIEFAAGIGDRVFGLPIRDEISDLVDP